MKGKLFLTVGIGICGIVCVLILYLVPSLRPTEKPSPTAVRSVAPFDGGYLLTLEDGFVAVKQIGEQVPCRVFGLPETMLSDYDRALLERGILCSSAEEAEQVAADFIG